MTDPSAPRPHPHRRFDELARLDGRVVLVTGGAGCIGQVAVAGLAEQGAHVIVVDREQLACDAVADEVTASGGAAQGVATNLENEDEVRGLAAQVAEEHGRLDGLVQLAALVSDRPLPGWTTRFEDQQADVWRRALEVNLTAAFLLVQACTPDLRASGHGSVVLAGSTYGLVGPDWRIYDGTDMGNAAAYAASKGGITQLARWLATTLAPDIRVNTLTPGGVERGQPASFVEAYQQRTPLGRMATEEDYKGAIVFLVSDLSRYVTGHNLVVDGGWTAW